MRSCAKCVQQGKKRGDHRTRERVGEGSRWCARRARLVTLTLVGGEKEVVRLALSLDDAPEKLVGCVGLGKTPLSV